MNNFIFYNPTRLLFGKGMINQLTQQIPADKRIMITFGGGSVKTNGVYEQVTQALEGRDYTEFWGIEANPDIDTLKKAIAIGKEKNIDFLLAVGGGSVIDGTKLISAGIPYEGDAWELVKKGSSQVTIPLGTVLTIPATGSEMNNGAVISRRETHEKYPFYADYPVFSILDPTVTFSLPDFQIACGLADTFVHVMEQYMTKSNESYLMERKYFENPRADSPSHQREQTGLSLDERIHDVGYHGIERFHCHGCIPRLGYPHDWP